MAQTASIVAEKFRGFLTANENGIGAAVAALSGTSGIDAPVVPPENVVHQNAPIAIAERSIAVKYPVVHVYCDRIQNLLVEKFRRFSGKVRTVAEIRVSQDRIEGLEEQTRLYVDAITQVLDQNRGSWDQGMFYTGGYEVKFEPVQHGGRNLLQIAKVIFEVDLSS